MNFKSYKTFEMLFYMFLWGVRGKCCRKQ